MIGANDVTHRIDKSVAVRHLAQAVRALRDAGAEVVVGTCPDLGTIEPVAQPLRLLARRWSRDLAAAQTVAVVEAGGRTVSLGDLLGPEFCERPHEMFSSDRFHPSPAGYARAAAALLPSVCAALGLWVGEARGRRRTAAAARASSRSPSPRCQAVRDPGTEVSPTAVGGPARVVPAGAGPSCAGGRHEPGHRPRRAGRRDRARRSRVRRRRAVRAPARSDGLAPHPQVLCRLPVGERGRRTRPIPTRRT